MLFILGLAFTLPVDLFVFLKPEEDGLATFALPVLPLVIGHVLVTGSGGHSSVSTNLRSLQTMIAFMLVPLNKVIPVNVSFARK